MWRFWVATIHTQYTHNSKIRFFLPAPVSFPGFRTTFPGPAARSQQAQRTGSRPGFTLSQDQDTGSMYSIYIPNTMG